MSRSSSNNTAPHAGAFSFLEPPMQYILTQAEYDELRRAQGVITTAKKSELQKLCTDAANHIPITRDWAPNEPPAPWGCILDESSPNHGGYCDDCPAKEVCPHDYKVWSK